MPEDAFIHIGLIKSRMVGTGKMALFLKSFDDLEQIEIVSFDLSPTSSTIKQRLCNYTQQGIILRGAATQMDDSFRVQDIKLFVKPIYSEFPA
jgi:hypothetical protein